MNSPSTQKIITVFLILAALTSSFVFLLSNTGIGGTASPVGQIVKQVSMDGKTAFVESPSSLPSYNSPLLTRSDMGSTYATITDNFTDQLVQKLMAANPNGPDLSKKNPLAMPTQLGDLGGIGNQVTLSFAPQLQDKKIKIANKYTPEDVLNYLNSAKSALTDILVPGLAQLNNESMSLQSLGDISAMYDSVENKIYQTSVPAPLSKFNRALLGFVDAQRTFFDQTDPAKTLIALQNPALVLAPYRQALESEQNKLKEALPKLVSFLDMKNSSGGILNAILGIQTAYAWDFIGGISNIFNIVLKALSNVYAVISKALQQVQWLQKIFTEVLKNLLVKKLVAQTLQWVQGGGQPQYVQNWKQFLGDSFNTAAGGIISKYAPQLCSNFGPLVQVVLTPPSPQGAGYSGGSNPYSCTPDMVAANLAGFAQNFESGGWVAYSALQQPQNNYYGTLLQLSEASALAGSKAQAASQNSANSASGFLSTKDCKDKITVNPEDYGGGVSSESDARALFADAFISCSDAKCSSVTICNPENSNAWQETTPGKLISDTLSKNLGGSSLERIVNAQDLTGLANAFLNAALSKLVQLGQKGLSNLTADNVANENGTLANTCSSYPASSTAYTQCVADNGGITKAGTSASSKDVVLPELQNILIFKGQLIVEAGKVNDLLRQTLGALQTASSSCAIKLDETSSTIDGANTLQFIDQNLVELMDASSTYQGIIDDLTTPGAKDKTIAHLNSIVSAIQAGNIKFVATELDIPLTTSGDERQIEEQFYNDLSLAMNNPGSTFGQLFGSLDSVSTAVGDAKTYQITLSSPQAGCGILEKANLLNQLKIDSKLACSIAVVETNCKSFPAPK